MTRQIERKVEPGSILIAQNGLLQHLDFVGQWRLAAEESFERRARPEPSCWPAPRTRGGPRPSRRPHARSTNRNLSRRDRLLGRRRSRPTRLLAHDASSTKGRRGPPRQPRPVHPSQRTRSAWPPQRAPRWWRSRRPARRRSRRTSRRASAFRASRRRQIRPSTLDDIAGMSIVSGCDDRRRSQLDDQLTAALPNFPPSTARFRDKPSTGQPDPNSDNPGLVKVCRR